MWVTAGLALHFLPPGEAAEVAAGYMCRLPPGSVLAVTCWRVDSPLQWARVSETWAARTGTAVWNLAPAKFADLFGGMETLAGPGPAAWPHGLAYVLGGADRKP